MVMAITWLSASELAVLTLASREATKEETATRHLRRLRFLSEAFPERFMTETTETPNGSILTILTKTTIPPETT